MVKSIQIRYMLDQNTDNVILNIRKSIEIIKFTDPIYVQHSEIIDDAGEISWLFRKNTLVHGKKVLKLLESKPNYRENVPIVDLRYLETYSIRSAVDALIFLNDPYMTRLYNSQCNESQKKKVLTPIVKQIPPYAADAREHPNMTNAVIFLLQVAVFTWIFR